MRPPSGCWRRIWPKAKRAAKNIPVKFSSTVSRHCFRSISSIKPPGPSMPALLNNTSSRPVVLTNSANLACSAISSVTSAAKTCAPACPAATSSNASWRRAISPTCQPASKNVRAVVAPMPELAPVIMIVLLIHLALQALMARVRRANHPRLMPPLAVPTCCALPKTAGFAPV